MLVVRVEIWPYGAEDEKYQIAELRAANIGGQDPCRYTAELWSQGLPEIGQPPFSRSVTIEAHDRRDGPWSLIHKILDRALGRPQSPK